MSLRSLIVRVTGDKSGLDSTLKGAESSMNSFGNVVKKIGGFIGVAFGVHQLIEFGKEASKAAAEAEGIKNAFAKIGGSGVLDDLRKATRGLIGDTALMKLAIKGESLGIPFKDMGLYLDYATKRSIATGQSIDELSDAIINGIGRNSSRSFVTLGISVNAINEAIKKTGDRTSAIKELVSDKIKDMGDVAIWLICHDMREPVHRQGT